MRDLKTEECWMSVMRRPALYSENQCREQGKLTFLTSCFQCSLQVIFSQSARTLEFTYFEILTDVSTTGKIKFKPEFDQQDLPPHFYLFFGQSLCQEYIEKIETNKTCSLYPERLFSKAVLKNCFVMIQVVNDLSFESQVVSVTTT